MGAVKLEEHAREHWGPVFDAIPKSVFATVAWHLANIASDNLDQDGAAETRFLEELQALGQNNIIPSEQLRRTLAAIQRAAS